VVFHAGLVLGLELLILCFLIGGEDLEHLGLDAGVLDLEFDHGLGILGGQSAGLSFVEGAAGLKRFHGLMVLAHLLHEGLESRFFFGPDGLDLILLGAGEVELIGVEAEHVIELAVGPAAVHVLGEHDRGTEAENGGDGEGNKSG
jgi:hypothetical protein